jgi:hypothetical protein
MSEQTPDPEGTTTQANGAQTRTLAGPPLQSSSTWREDVLAEADVIQTLADHLGVEAGSPGRADLDRHLAIARQSAGESTGLWRRLQVNGVAFERAWARLNAAKNDLLRRGPDDYVKGSIPGIVRHGQSHMLKDDPRLMRLQDLAAESKRPDWRPTDAERELVVSVARTARFAHAQEVRRLRHFRNMLILVVLSMSAFTAILCIAFTFKDDVLPLCFTVNSTASNAPEREVRVVCPTRESELKKSDDVDDIIAGTTTHWDVLTVAGLGAGSAALAAAASLRNVRASNEPYTLVVTLAALKVLSGSLTAVFGIILMRGEFIPGLSALDFPGQILAWALIFGYAQQIFTGAVDTQAGRLLKGAETVATPVR